MLGALGTMAGPSPALAALAHFGYSHRVTRIRIEPSGPVNWPDVRVPGGRCAIRDHASSQFVSAILLVAPYAETPVTVEVGRVPSWPYVELTLEVMARFGVRVERDLHVPKAEYRPCRIEIEPDPAA